MGADRRRGEMVGVRGTLGVALATAGLVLVCMLLAAPAFADAKAVGGRLQYVDCDQVQSAAGFQYNAGSGAGNVNQDLHITQDQELACLSGDRDDRNDGNKDNNDNNDNNGTANDGTASADANEADDVLADTIVRGTLPNTGGFSLPALAGYALVVTGIFSVMCLIGRRR